MSARSSSPTSSTPSSTKRSSARKAKAVTEARPAFDPRTHSGLLPTPCIGVCVMHAQTGLCTGCLRTIEEIIEWGMATEERKRHIWIALESRRTQT
ncbi:MAG: DUF1289 domain-containing protein [Betaproteobacteria bacterium]|nr:DUF1289 domain-containing protein [Betaproteobacteria bacterium]